jgi:hypothetical protein
VDGSNDGLTQSDLHRAFAAEQVYRTDHGQWTADPEELQSLELSITAAAGATPLAEDVVYVDVQDDVLVLSGKSGSGTCFYLGANGSDGSFGYAEDEDCGPAESQELVNEWE